MNDKITTSQNKSEKDNNMISAQLATKNSEHAHNKRDLWLNVCITASLFAMMFLFFYRIAFYGDYQIMDLFHGLCNNLCWSNFFPNYQ